ncbi:MAG: hypothetical protein KTR31_25525 [Myxococcales bacterium]|nr:hypothetical protein [Myxococcales bacterium]
MGLIACSTGSTEGSAEVQPAPSPPSEIITEGETPTPDPTEALAVFEGCDGASFLASDAGPSEHGPWPVGAKTVVLPRGDGGTLTVEVWYPAQLGSEAGLERQTYPIEYALPASQRALIPPELSPTHTCDCYRDLPLDRERGPYPVVIFIHGTAAWRSQSLSTMALWASRGFVVASADHPGLWLADMLAIACPDARTGQRDVAGDVDLVRSGLADAAFLDGAIDVERLAVAGHSAGGSEAAAYAAVAGVQLVLPLAAATSVQAGPDLLSTVFMGALSDDVVSFDATMDAYEASSWPRRLVGVADAGHLLFSDICEIRNGNGDDILTIAQDVGVCGAQFAGFLFDCDPTLLDPEVGGAIVGHASVAALEETLMCQDRTDVWAQLGDIPEVEVDDFVGGP